MQQEEYIKISFLGEDSPTLIKNFFLALNQLQHDISCLAITSYYNSKPHQKHLLSYLKNQQIESVFRKVCENKGDFKQVIKKVYKNKNKDFRQVVNGLLEYENKHDQQKSYKVEDDKSLLQAINIANKNYKYFMLDLDDAQDDLLKDGQVEIAFSDQFSELLSKIKTLMFVMADERMGQRIINCIPDGSILPNLAYFHFDMEFGAFDKFSKGTLSKFTQKGSIKVDDVFFIHCDPEFIGYNSGHSSRKHPSPAKNSDLAYYISKDAALHCFNIDCKTLVLSANIEVGDDEDLQTQISEISQNNTTKRLILPYEFYDEPICDSNGEIAKLLGIEERSFDCCCYIS
ncbi:hypothetical protein ACA351_00405 [Orientia tsutsugamushi]|uniref:hypothetical protein n=1 Tax=Orientia tsutsugamushi TaxID=784 RepID=UPI003529421C